MGKNQKMCVNKYYFSFCAFSSLAFTTPNLLFISTNHFFTMALNNKFSSLGSKPMRSLGSRPSKLDSDPFSDNDFSFTSETSNNKRTLITPPTNTLPLQTKSFDSDIRSLEPTVKRSKLTKRTRTPVFDTLNSKNSTSSNNNDTKYQRNPSLDSFNSETLNSKDRKKKKDVYVYHNLGGKESGLLNLENDTEMDNVMKEFDVDELQEKSNNLKNELDTYLESKEKRDRGREYDATSLASKYITEHLRRRNSTLLDITDHADIGKKRKTIDSFHKNNNHSSHKSRGLSLESLINNKDKYNAIKNKFEKRKPYIKPTIIISIDDVKKIVKTYKKLLIDILNGDESSFFYNEAKKLQQSSNLMNIKYNEIDNLPKYSYYGYIGAVRGFHIGKIIEEDPELCKLIKEKMKFNKVIQFWGVFNFTQYVLTPELIAHIVLKNGNLLDMDDAYDELEDTNEYGIYVTNTIELGGKDEDYEVIDSQEEKGKDTKEIKKEPQIIAGIDSNLDSDSDLDSINISDDEDDFMEKILKQTKKN